MISVLSRLSVNPYSTSTPPPVPTVLPFLERLQDDNPDMITCMIIPFLGKAIFGYLYGALFQTGIQVSILHSPFGLLRSSNTGKPLLIGKLDTWTAI